MIGMTESLSPPGCIAIRMMFDRLCVKLAPSVLSMSVKCICVNQCLCSLQLTERLTSLSEESHNTQMKKLKDICDK